MSDGITQERIDRLRAVPILSDLDEAGMSRVLDIANEYEVEAGHVLIRPDQPGAGLFIIEEGTVVVERRAGDIELGEGEFVGDLALLSEDAVHSARVCARTRTRFLAIARDDFGSLIKSEPQLALSMLRVLAHRLWLTTRS